MKPIEAAVLLAKYGRYMADAPLGLKYGVSIGPLLMVAESVEALGDALLTMPIEVAAALEADDKAAKAEAKAKKAEKAAEKKKNADDMAPAAPCHRCNRNPGGPWAGAFGGHRWLCTPCKFFLPVSAPGFARFVGESMGASKVSIHAGADPAAG